MTDPRVANGGDMLDVAEVASVAGVRITNILAAVIELGLQPDLVRLGSVTCLRRWAADAVIAHLADQRRSA